MKQTFHARWAYTDMKEFMFDICFKNIMKTFCFFKSQTCISFWESITFKKHLFALIAWITDKKALGEGSLLVSCSWMTENREQQKQDAEQYIGSLYPFTTVFDK